MLESLPSIQEHLHGKIDVYCRLLRPYFHCTCFKDVRLVTYTLIFVFIASRVIDLISEGGYAGKGFMVITNHPEELAKKIDEDLGR